MLVIPLLNQAWMPWLGFRDVTLGNLASISIPAPSGDEKPTSIVSVWGLGSSVQVTSIPCWCFCTGMTICCLDDARSSFDLEGHRLRH